MKLMKRKQNLLETFGSCSIHDVEFQASFADELRSVFGVHGFETTFHFVDTYGQ
jgi:hypothetical protein